MAGPPMLSHGTRARWDLRLAGVGGFRARRHPVLPPGLIRLQIASPVGKRLGLASPTRYIGGRPAIPVLAPRSVAPGVNSQSHLADAKLRCPYRSSSMNVSNSS